MKQRIRLNLEKTGFLAIDFNESTMITIGGSKLPNTKRLYIGSKNLSNSELRHVFFHIHMSTTWMKWRFAIGNLYDRINKSLESIDAEQPLKKINAASRFGNKYASVAMLRSCLKLGHIRSKQQ